MCEVYSYVSGIRFGSRTRNTNPYIIIIIVIRWTEIVLPNNLYITTGSYVESTRRRTILSKTRLRHVLGKTLFRIHIKLFGAHRVGGVTPRPTSRDARDNNTLLKELDSFTHSSAASIL